MYTEIKKLIWNMSYRFLLRLTSKKLIYILFLFDGVQLKKYFLFVS